MARRFHKRIAVVVLAAVVSIAASGPTTSAPPALSIYGNLPGVERVSLSRSGERLAVVAIVKGQRRLVVVDKDMHPVSASVIGDVKVRGLYWAGDETVLLEKSDTISLNRMDFVAPKAEVYSVIVVPLGAGDPWSVFADFPLVTGGVSGFYGIRQRDSRYFGYFGGLTYEKLGSGRELLSSSPFLYEVDLQSQATTEVASRIQGDGWRDWILDADGKVLVTFEFRSRNGAWTIRNRHGDEIASGTNRGGAVELIGLGVAANSVLYSLNNEEANSERWMELSLSGGEPGSVFGDLAFRGPIIDAQGRMIGYVHEGDTPGYTLFEEHKQKVINGTLKAFPESSVHLIDWNEQFDKLVVMTEGVGDPQTWWLVDTRTGKAQDLGTSYPIDAKDVAPMKTIDYRAADGMTIAAVLTLPPKVTPEGLPVVVLPHGGPHQRDYPGFDWWAQAFAVRGYAVLQPNFRGSTGYGRDFERAGYGEWGRKMQTDLSDGLAHLVEKGIADPKRACIMGASYGGYAALAGVTLQTGIYRCAVSVAGIGDLAEMVATDLRESGSNPMLARALKRQIGSRKDLRAVSPIEFAKSADAPILLVHGKDDIVVRYEQSADMAEALRKSDKPVEFVTLEGEDHWLSKAATRLAMLEAAVAFVETHNPPGQVR